MKKWVWSIWFLGMAASLSASHIVGGHFEITQLNDSLFKIDLVILRDCAGILPRPVYSARIFEQDSTPYKNAYLELQDPELVSIGDSCFSPFSLCIEKYIATETVVISGNAPSYFIVVQEFARNANITNIVKVLFPDGIGMTYLAKIPNQSLPGGNSTPVFKDYPPNGYLCVNQLRSIDFSATDPDGDSLAYRMVTPLEGHDDASVGVVPQLLPKDPPYSNVTWAPGYSLSQITPGPVPLQIHPVSGEVTAQPDQFGLFVFSYAVDEFRNGVKIGEVRRDLQLEVLKCTENKPPEFLEPSQPVYQASVGEIFCIDVLVDDPNPNDTVLLSSAFSSLLPGLSDEPEVQLVNRLDVGRSRGQLCWKPSCEETFGQQQLTFTLQAISFGCDGIDTISKTVMVKINPVPEQVLGLFPNVFTPNGDGINDLFTLQDEQAFPCLSELSVRIYNRWGVEVYHNLLDNRFGWDGRFKGNAVPAGVYFYLVSGFYAGQPVELRNFVTLFR